MLKVYLDTNIWGRAFDEQVQERIKDEANAFFEILRRLDEGRITIISSIVLEDEIGRIKNKEKREAVSNLVGLSVSERITDIPAVYKEIMRMGLKVRDSAHIACAIKGGAKYFITADDGILKRREMIERLNIKVRSPIEFIKEVL